MYYIPKTKINILRLACLPIGPKKADEFKKYMVERSLKVFFFSILFSTKHMLMYYVFNSILRLDIECIIQIIVVC